MNTKMLFGGLIGGIAFFLLGWLIWGMALAGVMDGYSNATCARPESEQNMILVGVACLLYGMMLAYIFSKANVATFSNGAVTGAIIAILIGLFSDLMSYVFTTNMTSLTAAWISIPANAVSGGIVGGLIGWWLGRK